MKTKQTIILFSLLLSLDVWAQDNNANYVQTTTKTGENSQIVTIEYLDGLGRPFETVNKAFSPSGKDLVTLQNYDLAGRESNSWLPYPFSSTGNPIEPSTFTSTATSSSGFYGQEGCPFTTIDYDNSPLNRVKSETGPGIAWRAYAKKKKMNYLTSGPPVTVNKYEVSSDSKTFTYSGTFSAGELSIEKNTDEDNHVTYTAKDLHDRIIMQRSANSGDKDTYYLYDKKGNLVYVLPPAASEQLTSSATQYGINTSAIVEQYAYYYEYDNKNRCTKKKLPGCSPVTMVYDRADRLVYSQNGNQLDSLVWTYYLYDSFGRQVVSGIHRGATPPSVSNIIVKAQYDANGQYAKYSCNIAGLDAHILSANYYDSYDFCSEYTSGSELGFTSMSGYWTDSPSSNHATDKGRLTGQAFYQLKSSSMVPDTTYTVKSIYYDERGNIVQTHESNYLKGWDDVYFDINEYTGTVLKKKHVHTAQNKPTRTEVTQYAYDHGERLVSVTHSVNNSTPVTIAAYEYDDIGRVATKTVGGIESVSYEYNVRSWLKKISSNHFEEYLSYNADNGSAIPSVACYNGNVSAMSWKSGSSSTVRSYQFLYDNQNFLTWATYLENNTANSRYTTRYVYDSMGNITTLWRYGLRDNNTYGLIDNLSYTYNGNQLVTVTDAVSGPNYSGAFHFRDGADEDSEYEYDQNGNLTKDLNKKITQIKYNLLNLPSNIAFMINYADYYISHTYSADGRLLHTDYPIGKYVGPVIDNPIFGSLQDVSETQGHPIVGPVIPPIEPSLLDNSYSYCDNIIYHNGTVSQILFDGGYVSLSGSTPTYHYYLQDHLGNNRAVIKQDGTIEQVNHYYPFGGLFGESTDGDVQRFKYNGKELERMHGLDWYDYGARHLDAALGRWSTIDPMAEKYYNLSPYNYCGNNPIKFVDPDGRDSYYSLSGEYLFTDDKETDNIIIRNQAIYAQKQLTNADWLKPDCPIQDITLSAEAYSNIFTHILESNGYVEKNNLIGNDIGVVVFNNSDTSYDYNDSFSLGNHTVYPETNGSSTPSDDGKIGVAAIINSNTIEDNRYMFSTISNVVNLLGVHEYQLHGVSNLRGAKNHLRVYQLQMKDPSWSKTTDRFKNTELRNMSRYDE